MSFACSPRLPVRMKSQLSMTRISVSNAPRLLILSLLAALVCNVGCSSGFSRIDSSVDRLLVETSRDINAPVEPSITRLKTEPTQYDRYRDPTAEYIPTANPAADELEYTPRDEADLLTTRLYADPADSDDAIQLNLNQALQYAMQHSREYRFIEEEYVLSVLRLLIERHLWGPRFFNDTTALLASTGDDGFFDTSMNLVNEFTVSQRLPYGGQVAATALARVSEDLHSRINTSNQSAELILSAQLPLLRGAGTVARESRIQAERDVIYEARAFEQARREFLFSVVRDFLSLVVSLQAIENAERQVESLIWLEARSRAFVESGRETPIDLALAQRSRLFAEDTANRQQETFRLALERFKVRIGMPSEQPLEIIRSNPGLPIPEIELDEAVRRALSYRLDIQTRRDQLDDARRRLDNARNDLLPDLDIGGFVAMGTDPNRRRGGVALRPENSEFEASVTLGLPLDREIERINVRQAQIGLERAVRDYQQFRDQLAVETRGAVRAIDQAAFSARIQRENVLIAERAEAAIRADPDRATPRDRTEAVDALLRAQDELDAANRDLQVAILEYLLLSGQLRVKPDGTIEPLRGMELAETDPVGRINNSSTSGS